VRGQCSDGPASEFSIETKAEAPVYVAREVLAVPEIPQVKQIPLDGGLICQMTARDDLRKLIAAAAILRLEVDEAVLN